MLLPATVYVVSWWTEMNQAKVDRCQLRGGAQTPVYHNINVI